MQTGRSTDSTGRPALQAGWRGRIGRFATLLLPNDPVREPPRFRPRASRSDARRIDAMSSPCLGGSVAKSPSVTGSPIDRLDSWKEIAAYLNRGVRTVRRWEHDEHLPVHRHQHRVQGSVYAFKSEIDAWRRVERRHAPASVPAAAGLKSIAVLPFANVSPDPDDAYFADGLTNEVTADLAKVRSLRVISRMSSIRFKDTSLDAKTIAAELGARYLVEGSVRRSGGRLRITAQLVDAAADDHLWADKYDGSVDDVFAFQERLARTIVGALELRLTADEDRRLAERPIADVHAYECYLRARQEAWRWRRDAIDHAIQLLHNGLDLVGDNARLYAALGFAHLQYREAGLDFSDGPLDEAEACARKAFALAPASAAGLQLRGWIHYSRGRIQEAVRDLHTALDVDPNSAETVGLLSNCYLISGRVGAARPLIARLLEIDPLTPLNRCMPGWADILEGRFEAAIEPYRQMFAMDVANPMARLFYVWVLLLNRRTDSVARLVDAFPSDVRDTVPGRLASFLVRALDGSAASAHALVTAEVEAAARTTDLFPRILAQGYALAGLAERATYWLDAAIDRGFINYPYLAHHDPFFQPLRLDSRFIQLLDIVRHRWEQFAI
jgi:TolB-like protein